MRDKWLYSAFRVSLFRENEKNRLDSGRPNCARFCSAKRNDGRGPSLCWRDVLNRYHSLLRYCNSTDPFSETKCESPSAGYERFSWRAIFAGIEESSSREEDSRRNHFGNYPPPFHPFLPLERLPSLTAAPLIVDIVLTVLKPSAARARLSSRNLLLESAFYPRVSEVRWEIIVTGG